MPDRESTRRTSRWIIVFLGVVLCWALAILVPAPFVIERPGPVVNALGEVQTEEGAVPVIVISGAETYPTAGELNVLSVSIVGSPESPPNWLEVGGALLDPTRTLTPMGDVYPEGVSSDDRAAAAAAMMRASQQRAIAAALRELGEPVDARLRVSSVVADGPSDGVLLDDDIIRSVDGAPVEDAADLGRALAAATDGVPLDIGIERQGGLLHVRVVPVSPEPDSAPMLGVLVYTEFEASIAVELQLGDIGGPSAGMMFAVAIIDLLTPGELTGGLKVSGTGTIDADGRIGAIGGLEQKLWGASRAGAELFLVPMENCGDIPGSIPGDMTVVPVATLDDALSALEIAAAGGLPPGLETCSAGEFVSSSR